MSVNSALEVQVVDFDRRRLLGIGALAGVLATVLFIVVHQFLISNIWAMLLPMAFSGAACGIAITWSYGRVSDIWITESWFGLSSAFLGSLFALGIVSLIVFAPEWTFAELNVDDPPLGDLFSRATPLMVAFTIAAGGLIWWILGARKTTLIPILATETLLVLLLGHNVAIIGLVDLTADGWSLVWLMFALVAFLGVSYTVLVVAVRHILG